MSIKPTYVTAEDGTRIAYDVCGSGPAIVLLHGGSGTRIRDWHELGYVKRLKDDFTVITIDARGHGDSDKPTAVDAYDIATMRQDILDVVDACQVDSFTIWGFSYGGNIGRFLAVGSERVTKLIVIGIPMGSAASERFQRIISGYRERWGAILKEHQDGTLEVASLSEAERDHLETGHPASQRAWLGAIPTWGSVEPAELPCPLLWMVGTENESAMSSVKEYRDKLEPTNVELVILDGLDHRAELTEIDTVYPVMIEFTRRYQG